MRERFLRNINALFSIFSAESDTKCAGCDWMAELGFENILARLDISQIPFAHVRMTELTPNF
jgi:hypothetical protein